MARRLLVLESLGVDVVLISGAVPDKMTLIEGLAAASPFSSAGSARSDELSPAVIGLGAGPGIALVLVATGFTIVYRATGVLNFATGEQLVLGGCRYLLYDDEHVPFVAVVVLVIVIGALGGALVDRVVLGPVARASVLTKVIVLLALSQALDAAYLEIFGSQPTNSIRRVHPRDRAELEPVRPGSDRDRDLGRQPGGPLPFPVRHVTGHADARHRQQPGRGHPGRHQPAVHLHDQCGWWEAR